MRSIVVFTSDENNGGIKQFAFQLLSACNSNGYEAVIMLPDLSSIRIPEECAKQVIRFRKSKEPFGLSDKIKVVAQMINSMEPDCVLFCDDAVFSVQVLRMLNKRIRCYVTIHDVNPHPDRFNLRRRIVYELNVFYRRIAFKRCYKVILLSQNSVFRFAKRYPTYSAKAMLLPLGAHPPKGANAQTPEEMYRCNMGKYILFFGRIERYKGVGELLDAYNMLLDEQKNELNLIIAGNGRLSDYERKKAENIPQVHIVNRYIDDGEMIWLFRNCKCVVVPYIEASQSGVIPMAYHFHKPVIANNIDGLREYVIDGETGLLVNSSKELAEAMMRICKAKDGDLEKFSINCARFEQHTFDWTSNIKRIIGENEINGEEEGKSK